MTSKQPGGSATAEADPALVVAPKHWKPLRAVFREFIEAHEELGLRFTENTYRNFSRIHGPALLKAGVLRKPGLRQPYIADVRNFDSPAFDLISTGGYSQSIAEGISMTAHAGTATP